MNRFLAFAGLMALACILTVARAEEDKKDKKKEDKIPSIKAIMKATHGKTAFQGKVSAALKEKDFETITKVAKEWEKCAIALGKNTPKKGEKESWEKLTEAYSKNIATMIEGAEKKDAKVVQGALGFVGSSCGKCHGPHK